MVDEHLWTLFVQWHKEFKATEPEVVPVPATTAAPAAEAPTSAELDETLGVPSKTKLDSAFAGLKKRKNPFE